MSSKKAAQSPRVKAHSLKVTPSAKKLKKKSSSRALVDTLESVTSVEDDVDPMSSSRPMDRSITSLAEEKSMGQVMKVSRYTAEAAALHAMTTAGRCAYRR